MDISSTIAPAPSILASRVSELPSPIKASAPAEGQRAEKGFATALSNAIGDVNSLQADAADQIKAVAAGESQDLHGTMIAIEKAGIALKLTTQIRNKAIEAYQEIMRMQV